MLSCLYLALLQGIILGIILYKQKIYWKNVGDLESKCIQQIKFDDCPGSQYYFFFPGGALEFSISSFTFLLDSISWTVKYSFACDLHSSSLLKYLKRVIIWLTFIAGQKC